MEQILESQRFLYFNWTQAAELLLSSQITINPYNYWPFNARCPLKGHTYLHKPAAESMFKNV